MKQKTTLARKAASTAMCAALACAGAIGIVGAQALAPTDAGLVQQAEAKYFKTTGTYDIMIRHYNPGTCTAKIKGWKLYLNGLVTDISRSKELKRAKRVIKISKKVKCSFYAERKVKMSFKSFKRDLNEYGGAAMKFKIKKGKITALHFHA